MGKIFRSPSQATTSSFTSYTNLTKSERRRQKTKKNIRSFGKFLYNKQERTFCNKTCKNWCLLITFYLIFLTILWGIFFGVVLFIMYSIRTTRNEPLFDKETLSPALGISPRLPDRVTTIIWYTSNGKNGQEPYIKAIDKLLKPYDRASEALYVDCDEMPLPKGKYCKFTREMLGPCGEKGYGYYENKPCVYVKLNKIKGWVPQHHNQKRENETMEKKNTEMQDEIYIRCTGISNFDKDHMGELSFYPSAGFKNYYFPFDGSRNYMSPLVGIQFENLDPGFVIGIRCYFKHGIETIEDTASNAATVFVYIDSK